MENIQYTFHVNASITNFNFENYDIELKKICEKISTYAA